MPVDDRCVCCGSAWRLLGATRIASQQLRDGQNPSPLRHDVLAFGLKTVAVIWS
jgi:hypothetical protein